MSERVIEWVTKTDFGKFPKGTEHVKIENPYGVGYEGRYLRIDFLMEGKEDI
jgi:hypothetical protein